MPRYAVPGQQQGPYSLWPSTSPDLNQAEHLGDELDRRVRGRVNGPADVHGLIQALSQGSHPIASDPRTDPVLSKRCWVFTDSRGGHTPCWLCVPQSLSTDWLNCFLDEKSVKIVNFDLNQLQKWSLMNLIFYWIFEHQLNSKTNQTCISFFEQYSSTCRFGMVVLSLFMQQKFVFVCFKFEPLGVRPGWFARCQCRAEKGWLMI